MIDLVDIRNLKPKFKSISQVKLFQFFFYAKHSEVHEFKKYK
tara:strand:- start:226 stop:351 length:126 start_codon:yes stop_codon:yes gene_type:complete